MTTSPHERPPSLSPVDDCASHGVIQSVQGHLNDLVDPWVLREIERRGFTEFLYRQWTVDVDEIEPGALDVHLPGDLTIVRRGVLLNAGRLEAALEGLGGFAVVSLVRRSIWVAACGHDLATARGVLGALQNAFPEPDEGSADDSGDPTNLLVALWDRDNEGRVVRRLEVTPWARLAGNYPGRVRGALAGFMRSAYRPDASGLLHVWHGPPGTGKSYALGALAHAWRSWALIAYVTDPEALLNIPGYLHQLILSPAGDKWRLVVLEDTGELFGRDARREAGQGLSRLLNATDGMIGKGSKTIFIVTTNEPIEGFHEAAVRPGRCAARVEFPPFDLDEARKWLVDHDAAHVAERLSTPVSLAELYAMTRGEAPPPRPRPVGFTAP